MPVIVVKLGPEPIWPDLAEKWEQGDVYHLGAGAPPIQVSGLEGGMKSGKPSVVIRLDLPDGKAVVAETSWVALHAACAALRGRFGDPE